jgi:hypothetical protein
MKLFPLPGQEVCLRGSTLVLVRAEQHTSLAGIPPACASRCRETDIICFIVSAY